MKYPAIPFNPFLFSIFQSCDTCKPINQMKNILSKNRKIQRSDWPIEKYSFVVANDVINAGSNATFSENGSRLRCAEKDIQINYSLFQASWRDMKVTWCLHTNFVKYISRWILHGMKNQRHSEARNFLWVASEAKILTFWIPHFVGLGGWCTMVTCVCGIACNIKIFIQDINYCHNDYLKTKNKRVEGL